MEEEKYVYWNIKKANGTGTYKKRVKAKTVKCLDCGYEWLIERHKPSPSFCRECKVKGERNPMFGRKHPNKGNIKFDSKAYQRNYANKRRMKMKTEIIKFMGNRCALCLQENLPICVWHFHHREKEEKIIAVSQIITYGTKKLFDEIKKCILLCANCHLVIHRGDERLIAESEYNPV